ncbi:MAG: LamG-like jellyroll fold domain-containing protein [Candidatus Accumulibacter meliphilus]|uniref:LamG-like jellyroll fold domain-containing protein n=1 Tax=Candidatus Accumulibacter meliphilus TaxID=2211374 RepID=UPI002FC31759
MKTNRIFLGLATGVFVLGMESVANAAIVGHWGFDEMSGATAFDSFGSVNGTLVGGAAFTTTGGVKGGSVQITNGYVTMGNNFPATSSFSIEAWVKLNSGDVSGMTPVAKHWEGIMQGYFLAINDIYDGFTRQNTEGFYSANGPYHTAVGGPPINDGLWHQLVGVYDSGTTRIYVDGNLSGVGSAGYADNAAEFIVGGMFGSAGVPVNRFNGFIDEVGTYDSALSSIEIQEIYDRTLNSGAAVPEPGSMLLLGISIASLIAARRRTGVESGGNQAPQLCRASAFARQVSCNHAGL